MSLRVKFVIILILPMLGLVYFGTHSVIERQAEIDQMAKMERFINLVVKVTEFVHASQTERGLSAGYIGANGDRFKEELTAQRLRTDQRIDELRTFISTFDIKAYEARIERELNGAVNLLDRLKDFRTQIDDRNIGMYGVLDFFEHMHAAFFIVVEEIPRLASDAGIATEGTSYINFVEGKEIHGIERAILTSTFANNAFADGAYRYFTELVATRASLLTAFEKFTSQENQKLFRKIIDGPVSEDVNRMREIALEKGAVNERTRLLYKLHQAIGYGGLIHNFKNFLIYRHEHHIDHFVGFYSEALEIFKTYRSLGISEVEEKRLSEIESAIIQYNDALRPVLELRAAGEPFDIYAVARVNDEPAVVALNELAKIVSGRDFGVDPTIWFTVVTQKMNLLKGLEDKLSVDFLRHAVERRTNATKELWLHLSIVAAAFLLTSLICIAFARGIVRQIGGEPADVVSIAQRVAAGDLNIELREDGPVTGIYAAVTDMVERLTDNIEQIRSGERRLKAFVDSATDSIVMINQYGIIQSANPATETAFGYAVAELIGRNISMLMPEPDRSNHDAYLRHHVETGEIRATQKGREVIGQHKDGHDFPLLLSVSRAEVDGEIMFSGVLHDLSAEQAARDQLIQASKLASLGTLATGIAHELRQPLFVMQGNADLEISDGVDGMDRESAFKTLTQVVSNCDRMNKIIDHLRTFAREGDGKGTEPVKMDAVLESAFTLMNQQFKSRGIEVVTDIPDSLPTVVGNANRLEQVFINLLGNARDALEELDDPKVTITIKEMGQTLLCTVTDNGPGVPAEIQAKIFDPFFTTKGAGKGTGLGLSISHGIITEHKGEISISDAPNGGAKFEISLPLAA